MHKDEVAAMNLLVITQYYWPETFVITGLVDSLQALGIKVTILTGKPNYPGGEVFPGYRAWGITREQRGQVDIVRVPLFARGKKSGWRLAANYVSFVAAATLLGPWLLRGKRFDAIFVFAPSPILQAVPAMLLARLRKIPLVLWVQDLWPQSLSATGYLKNPWGLEAVAWVVRRIYRASDRILVQSRAFIAPVAELTDKPQKIHYLPNPYLATTGSQPSERAAQLLDTLRRHFCVVFAGNLGSAQALDTIVEAARRLLPQADLRIVLVGSGSQDNWLEQRKSELRLDNMVLAGRFESSDMASIFDAASALLVTLKPDPAFELTIPSKVQAYLAAARPIIAALDGEGARVVEEAGAGFCSAAGDAGALAASILRMARLPLAERQAMGMRGRSYFNRHFAPERLVDELADHFKQVILAVENNK